MKNKKEEKIYFGSWGFWEISFSDKTKSISGLQSIPDRIEIKAIQTYDIIILIIIIIIIIRMNHFYQDLIYQMLRQLIIHPNWVRLELHSNTKEIKETFASIFWSANNNPKTNSV